MTSAGKESWRANYVAAPHYFNLNQACTLINRAFDGFGCYLVGSAIERRDHRDVDVRYIMKNEAFDRLFRCNAGQSGGHLNPLWSLTCTSVSLWLSQQSGLPVDFQIQRQSDANEKFSRKDGHQRLPLGIFLDYPDELPQPAGSEP